MALFFFLKTATSCEKNRLTVWGAYSGSRKTSQEAAVLARARAAGGHGEEPSEWADSSRACWKGYRDPDEVDSESKNCG